MVPTAALIGRYAPESRSAPHRADQPSPRDGRGTTAPRLRLTEIAKCPSPHDPSRRGTRATWRAWPARRSIRARQTSGTPASRRPTRTVDRGAKSPRGEAARGLRHRVERQRPDSRAAVRCREASNFARELRPPARSQEVSEERAEVEMVARYGLVGALPIQEHGDALLSGKPHDGPLRVNAQRSAWLILVPDHVLEVFRVGNRLHLM